MSAAQSSSKKKIAIAIGDPAGIGCEVVLKALKRPEIRAICDAVIVGDAWLVHHCNQALGIGCELRSVDSNSELRFDGMALDVLNVPARDQSGFKFGVVDADNGTALIEYAGAAIRLAQEGIVDSALGAPHNQTSVRRAGISFDGYPGFVARQTGTPEDDVFLLLASKSYCICHVTLHLPVRAAIERIRRANVLKAISATDTALRKMGLPEPRIAVSGLNPHAGENGLFGREEIEEIAPAIVEAKAAGVNVAGPFGADVMFVQGGYDGYVVMLHDQGHIPGKLEPGSAGFYAGAPVLFGSVAHGSAHDIAGKGIADPSSMVNALRWAARA